LVALTESSNGTRPRRNRAARASLLLGVLGVAVLPVAVAITEWRADLELVDAGYAVPAAFLFSALAVRLARRARRSLDRTLGRIGGVKTARAGRVLGWLGVYIALTATVSMGVYAYLEYVAAN
jgi:hypothetical protein